MNARLAPLFAAFAVAAAACSTAPEPDRAPDEPFARPAGYWEGKGTLAKTDLKDDFRHMERRAEYTFWFVLDGAGNVRGEVEVLYDASLTVKNLPAVSVPLPGTSMSFDPEIGGKVTDPNPRRRLPLGGTFANGVLHLEMEITPDTKPIEFTYQASLGLGAAGVSGARNGNLVEVMKMAPYSPFLEEAPVEKRPSGPFTSRYEVTDANLSVYWTATQISSREERR